MYTSIPQECVRAHVHYAVCRLTCTLNVHYENLQFYPVKGHVRDPSSNSVLLLTSSIYVPSFIILRQIVLELSWKQTDGQTDRETDIQDDRIKRIPVEYLINI